MDERVAVFARTSRRRFLAASLGCGAVAYTGRLIADEPRGAEAKGAISPDVKRAITQGLDFLKSKQTDEGSFGPRGYARNVAIAGLAGMAFMSAGNAPGRGPYGGAVTRCVDFLLASTQESGFIVEASSTSHGPMYGHGFATLFLAEAYGMAMRDDLRPKLSKAIDLIVSTQNSEGGWRYQPVRRDADISVTICEIMALRAARNAGLHAPNETVEKCVKYVKECQNGDGGFSYQKGGGASAFPRSAAGVVALYSAGIYEGREIEKGLEYLIKHLPTGKKTRAQDGHYYYGHYYAAQAMWHAGGDYWKQWYPAIRDELLESQDKNDGSWNDGSIGAEYSTAMACIVLQMPASALPIFQR